MKTTYNAKTPSPSDLADDYARRLTSVLSSGLDDMPYDISERLRASRMQALAKRKQEITLQQSVPAYASVGQRLGNTLGVSGNQGGDSDRNRWFSALISAVPILALAVGMVIINIAQDDNGIHEAAEVDAALLTDDLPPEAYFDPGFAQFLKMSSQSQ